MSNYKKIVPIALVFFMAVSIYSLFHSANEREKEYYTLLEEARAYSEKGLLADANQKYSKVLSMKSDVSLYSEIGRMYKDKSNLQSQISWGKNMVEVYPEAAEGYEYLMQAYYESGEYKSCFSLYDTYKKRASQSDKVESIYDKIKYLYEIVDKGYSSVSVFSSGYAVVEKEDRWGYVDETGSITIDNIFTSAGSFMQVAPVTDEDGNAYYIDTQGNKKYLPADGFAAESLGFFDGITYAAFDGEEYYYFNADNQKVSGPYDYAGTYNYDKTAVFIDGKWHFIDREGNAIFNGKEYDSVIFDARDIAFRNERVFVAQAGSLYYVMLDLEGNQVGTGKYEDAKAFIDNTYTAVSIGGKWGYIDKNGNIAIEPQYEDAKPFNNGYAPVKINGMWGYIDNSGSVVIEAAFEDAGNFTSKGYAFVKKNGVWNMLKLLKDNH